MATPTPLQHSLNERLTLSNQGQNLGLDQKTEKGLTDSSAPSISSEEAFTNRSGINEKALVRKMDWKGPILDDHFHLNRSGRFLDAAKDFQRVGGTDLVLVHCPDFAAPPTTRQGHIDSYANTIAMSEEVRGLGIGVRVILGPHPAAFAPTPTQV